ncbi:MAG: CapA family protein [Candidatus Brocadiia bacterium]|jgi:poly-gamma-glutamate synthesis protein (capsule biosynthesis protein)|nr:CapA family protein [Candidatus Brocadiia bacterium]
MDSGADIFHGHSAHLFQGIEIYRRKPIFYDTGELVDDYAVDAARRNDQGLIRLVSFLGGEVQRIELVPILISDMQVNEARGRVADEIAARRHGTAQRAVWHDVWARGHAYRGGCARRVGDVAGAVRPPIRAESVV